MKETSEWHYQNTKVRQRRNKSSNSKNWEGKGQSRGDGEQKSDKIENDGFFDSIVFIKHAFRHSNKIDWSYPLDSIYSAQQIQTILNLICSVSLSSSNLTEWHLKEFAIFNKVNPKPMKKCNMLKGRVNEAYL